jgi:hypothetical protein
MTLRCIETSESIYPIAQLYVPEETGSGLHRFYDLKTRKVKNFYRLGVLLRTSVVDQWFRLRLLLQVGTL